MCSSPVRDIVERLVAGYAISAPPNVSYRRDHGSGVYNAEILADIACWDTTDDATTPPATRHPLPKAPRSTVLHAPHPKDE